jgi:4-hydroxy-3-methylbut-2-enyl diphosphate reductase
MGVRRAVETAEAELDRVDGKTVYSLGPLIHNPQTLALLEKRGLRILDEQNEPHEDEPSHDAVVIIRAHGVGPAVEAALKTGGARVADATCPRVKLSQNTARLLAEQGYHVFLAGEKNHAEVRGIAGYIESSGAAYSIAGNAGEAGEAAKQLRRRLPEAKTALIAQTTFSLEEYARAAAAIREIFPGLEINDTICPATRERQTALRELCAAAGAIIAAGGNGSANTRRLLDIARSQGKPAWIAETRSDAAALAGELSCFSVVGLCAGASTPDSVIGEIEAELGRIEYTGKTL